MNENDGGTSGSGGGKGGGDTRKQDELNAMLRSFQHMVHSITSASASTTTPTATTTTSGTPFSLVDRAEFLTAVAEGRFADATRYNQQDE